MSGLQYQLPTGLHLEAFVCCLGMHAANLCNLCERLIASQVVIYQSGLEKTKPPPCTVGNDHLSVTKRAVIHPSDVSGEIVLLDTSVEPLPDDSNLVGENKEISDQTTPEVVTLVSHVR